MGLMLLIPVLLTYVVPNITGTVGGAALADEAGWNDVLLADPIRPFVYYANGETRELEYHNATTGAVDCGIGIGGLPLSLDMSVNMESIYVPVDGAGIVVIDIDGRSVSRVLPLEDTPMSVCDGRAERLYVGAGSDGRIRVLDSTTGAVIRTIDADVDIMGSDLTASLLVAASPDGATLLVTMMEMRPTVVGKYDISTDLPEYLGRYTGFGGYAIQQVVDWDDGILYLVNQDGYMIERMAIAGMSWLAPVCPFVGYAQGIAFSPDFNCVYVTTEGWPAKLYFFRNSNLSASSVIDSTSYLGPLIVDNANTSVFVVTYAGYFQLTRLTLSPEIYYVYPDQGDLLYDIEMEFRVRVWPGIPTVEPTGMGVMLDGMPFGVQSYENFDSWIDIWDGGMVYEHLVDGVRTLQFWFAWNGGNISAECTFTWETTWMNPPRLLPVFPAGYGVVETSPTCIEASLSNPEGEEAVILELIMELDGVQLEPYYSDPETVMAPVTENLPDGEHTVIANLLWTDGTRNLCSNATWKFYVQPPPEFVEYRHDSGFSLNIPSDWTVDEDLTVGETLIELKLTGPTIHDVAVTATVDVGLDSSIQEEEWYLRDIAWETLSALEDYGVEIWGDIQYVTIDGHLAAEFRMNWTSPEITQLMVIIVDEDNHQYWLMTFTSSSEDYYLMSPVYDEMIEGFDTGDSWIFSNPALLIGLLAAIAACIVIIAIWLVMRRQRGATQPPMPGPGPTTAPVTTGGPPVVPGAGFCPKCGNRIPFSEAKCPGCGAELPSPPFGGIAGADKNT